MSRTPAFLFALILLTGCSSGTGTRFTLFSDGHSLLESTKALRQPAYPPLPVPRELDKHPLPDYTVEPGDVLLVLAPEPETPPEEAGKEAEKILPPPIRIPADQPILPDGSINLGLYGRVIVAGKTVEEIEALVRATVAARLRRDPGFINVRVVSRESKVYYVLGEVNSPGAFPLKGRETVLDGILAAGGLNDRASRENIVLTRPTPPDSCRVVLPVCYREITQHGDTTTNYQLMPGDRIMVPTPAHEGGLFCWKKPCRLCNDFQHACPIAVETTDHSNPSPPPQPAPHNP